MICFNCIPAFSKKKKKKKSVSYALLGGVADSQINLNSIQQNIYCSKLKPFQSFYCLRVNVLLKGVVCLMVKDAYNYFIIPIRN